MRTTAPLRILLATLALAAAAPAFESEARADAEVVITKPLTQGRRLVELNLHFAAYYGYDWAFGNGIGYGSFAVGPGVDFLIPILRNGFIPSLNNAFYIGIYVDPLWGFTGLGSTISLAFGAYAHWRFFILKLGDGHLDAFANLGFGVWPWFTGGVPSVWITGFPLFQVGATYFFTKNIGVRVAFGYPNVDAGLTFAF